MKIPKDLVLTVEDIRYAKNIQLQTLTGIDASNFSAWGNRRGISEKNLDRIAKSIGMTKSQLMEALELKRADIAKAKLAQHKADKLIYFLLQQEQEKDSA